jgi:hypothetical protein
MDETFEMLVVAQHNMARHGGVEVIREHFLHEHPAAMMLVDSALAGRRYSLRRGQGWVFFRHSSRKPCRRGQWGPGQSKRGQWGPGQTGRGPGQSKKERNCRSKACYGSCALSLMCSMRNDPFQSSGMHLSAAASVLGGMNTRSASASAIGCTCATSSLALSRRF